MKTLQYFQGIFETLQEVRQVYYKLAMLHHPDRGGNTAIMQTINDEYEYLTKLILSGQSYKTWSNEYKETEYQASEDLMNIINDLMRYSMPGIIIEICGNWIWASGNTRPAKEDLKNIGFRFSANKLAWYWHPEGYKKRSGKLFSIDQIRNLWGSKVINVNTELSYIS
jgi:curved DNA-binding protein CbpA